MDKSLVACFFTDDGVYYIIITIVLFSCSQMLTKRGHYLIPVNVLLSITEITCAYMSNT